MCPHVVAVKQAEKALERAGQMKREAEELSKRACEVLAKNDARTMRPPLRRHMPLTNTDDKANSGGFETGGDPTGPLPPKRQRTKRGERGEQIDTQLRDQIVVGGHMPGA